MDYLPTLWLIYLQFQDYFVILCPNENTMKKMQRKHEAHMLTYAIANDGRFVNVDDGFGDVDVAPSLLGGLPVEAGEHTAGGEVVIVHFPQRLLHDDPWVVRSDDHFGQGVGVRFQPHRVIG